MFIVGISTSKSLKQKRLKSLNTDLLKLRKSRTYEKERTCKHSYITITNNKTINNTKDRQTDNGENKETDWQLEHLNTAVLSLIKKFRNPFRNFVFLSRYFIFSISSCERTSCRAKFPRWRNKRAEEKREEKQQLVRSEIAKTAKARKKTENSPYKRPLQCVRSLFPPHPFPPQHWFVRYFSP